ncbi:hypothetical protein D3C76_1165710 [compost metagenome]
MPSLNPFVRVLNHHHSGVHHRTDCNGYAPKRHDVGVDALVAHDDQGNEDTNRKRDDGDQR